MEIVMNNTETITHRAAFPLGELVITPNAAQRLIPREIHIALKRHESGDWGELCSEDKQENERAIQHGCRIFSAYGSDQKRFWIITEADRSVTTILMPQDY
jgi:hypothetical protein